MPKLTKRFVDSLRPVDSDTLYRDTDLAGFALRVKPSGARTWVCQYRNAAGRTRKLALGKVGVLTPEEARAKARRALAAVADGSDPSADRSARRDDPTMMELADRYLAEGPAAKPAKKASSWATDRSNVERHIKPLLGRKHLSALTRADIQKFQRDVTTGKSAADVKTGPRGRAIVEGGPGTAARATVVLAAMIQWGIAQGLCADNPAKGVKLNKLQSRERFLSTVELTALGDALASAEASGVNRFALAALRLLTLTGARKSEILSLRWEHVDFERAALRLPDSKTGAKVVPLGAPALHVLAALPRDDTASPFVFPAGRGTGHLIGLPAIWCKVSKLAGFKGVRIHDLRHGFASVAVADGSSLYIVGKVLGHTQAATTERYSHMDLDPVRATVDRTARKIADAMSASTQVRPGAAPVVDLAGHRRSQG